jgi:hypothetical protein
MTAIESPKCALTASEVLKRMSASPEFIGAFGVDEPPGGGLHTVVFAKNISSIDAWKGEPLTYAYIKEIISVLKRPDDPWIEGLADLRKQVFDRIVEGVYFNWVRDPRRVNHGQTAIEKR